MDQDRDRGSRGVNRKDVINVFLAFGAGAASLAAPKWLRNQLLDDNSSNGRQSEAGELLASNILPFGSPSEHNRMSPSVVEAFHSSKGNLVLVHSGLTEGGFTSSSIIYTPNGPHLSEDGQTQSIEGRVLVGEATPSSVTESTGEDGERVVTYFISLSPEEIADRGFLWSGVMDAHDAIAATAAVENAQAGGVSVRMVYGPDGKTVERIEMAVTGTGTTGLAYNRETTLEPFVLGNGVIASGHLAVSIQKEGHTVVDILPSPPGEGLEIFSEINQETNVVTYFAGNGGSKTYVFEDGAWKATESQPTNENTRIVEDYYGLGPAEITLVEQSEDWTQDYLNGTRAFPAKEVLIIDQNESFDYGIGNVDSLALQGVVLTGYTLEKVLLTDHPVLGRVESYRVVANGVYKLNGSLHKITFEVGGSVGRNTTDVYISDFAAKYELGLVYDLSLYFINPTETRITHKNSEEVLIQRAGSDLKKRDAWVLSQAAFGDGRTTSTELRDLLAQSEAILLPSRLVRIANIRSTSR